MGRTKTEKFTTEQNQMSEYAKAFAHPARVAILMELFGKQCICGDLVGVLDLAQSTVSQHLAELKRIGIIKGEIDGPRVCYCIDEEVWKKAQKAFADTFEAFDPKNLCC